MRDRAAGRTPLLLLTRPPPGHHSSPPRVPWRGRSVGDSRRLRVGPTLAFVFGLRWPHRATTGGMSLAEGGPAMRVVIRE
eukprot:scaffold155314_cov47-Tisochrysis_lutea.AAC.3